ncbi:twin-arginine translocase TatA/TatE family subunit [Streptomyces sp. AK010]|uniref:twin-arginine translocase TatA/TatE family subunit n=1 Tax=Streptomyces sp. AK010 TaxID=2723074 RepID=UPI00160EF238|nr:twin-arginine translocase TatA/TatE family subunit [Streptomyces sp. AK010]MBB6416174.1 sec-independent protein translocase protein TatA [Streptomyces sp. AK010]
MFGLSELAVILIVVIAVILAKKGPELARSAGKSARILKAEARAMKKEEENDKEADTPPRVIPGETAVPGTGATAPGMERPSAPAPERTERASGTPPQDSRP